MIEIRQLRCFAACVQAGSFSQAAVALYTTQSSVSKVIKSLEDELGIRLFERRHDGITLTEEGERVYRDVRPILDRLNRLQQGI